MLSDIDSCILAFQIVFPKTLAKRDMTRHVTGDVTRYLF